MTIVKNMHIGEQIKKKRKELGLSAEKLAERLSIKAATNIYKWENGSMPSDPEEYQRILAWLHGSENGVNSTITMRAEDRIAELLRDKEVLRESIQLSLNALLEGHEVIKLKIDSSLNDLSGKIAALGETVGQSKQLLDRFVAGEDSKGAVLPYTYKGKSSRAPKGNKNDKQE